MGIELAKAFVAVRGDVSQLGGDLEGAKPGILGMVSGLAGSIRGAITGVLAGIPIVGAIFKAGQFEQTTIAFETMIGSAEETKKTLASLTEFAAKTPFEMPQIEQAARGLIMFGERGDRLMETLNIIGNAASGTSSDFGMLALIFNQVRGVGKLLTQDFRQLSTRGVLSLQDIANYYKVTTEEAQNMLSTGKISFEGLRGLLASLSAEGGRFANMMEKQSKSLLGLWSTLKDAIGITARAIGELLMPYAKQFVTTALGAAEGVRSWIAEHSVLVSGIMKAVAVIIAYKAGVMAVSLIIRTYTMVTKAAAVATAFLTALQGPAGWFKLAAGMAAATGAIVLMNSEMGALEEKQKATEKTTATAAAGNVALAQSVNTLTEAQKNANASLAKMDSDKLNRADELRERTKLAFRAPADEYERLIASYKVSFFPSGVMADASAEMQHFIGLVQELQQAEGFQTAHLGILDLQKELLNTQFALDPIGQKLLQFEIPGVLPEQLAKIRDLLQQIEQSKAFNSAQQAIDDLKTTVMGLRGHLSDSQMALEKTFGKAGVTPEQRAEMEGLKAEETKWREARSMFDRLKTPMEKYNEEKARIEELYAGGFINDELRNRALEEARAGIEGGKVESNAPKMAGRFGIADFGKRIQDAIMQGDRDKNQKMMLREQQNSNEHLKNISNQTKNIKTGLA